MHYYDAILKKYFGYLEMPINVFGNSSSSHNNGIKTDTTLFVQKPYLRTIYIESNFEDDMDKKIDVESKI